MAHVTDIYQGEGFTSLLQGEIDWKSFIQVLKDIGHNGFLAAELASYDIFPEQMLFDTSAHFDRLVSFASTKH